MTLLETNDEDGRSRAQEIKLECDEDGYLELNVLQAKVILLSARV